MLHELIKAFLIDLRERFLTCETLGGLFMVIGGLILLFYPIVLQTWLAIGIIVWGLYKIFINRIKQWKEEEDLLAKRKFREITKKYAKEASKK